ncbi:MAG: tRNA (adenosine(37)-N6)-threonylcarbamoyltransferase complex ATPase subunit type 1 TsaE [Actinomycetota bacterium]|nr:MAG: tRNA (adenosine(37)-N6)-threonylcarbamoyltransferase complex ATPase subunit type 1 TsaE [Actinomycetota bacterium]
MTEPQSITVYDAEVPDADSMIELGRRLGSMLRAGDLVVLVGGLGAGKTTLTRGIGEGLRVRGPVTSPTFVLARVHPSLHDGPALVHVDAYRLGSLAEVEELDLETTVAQSVTVVEWGDDRVTGLTSHRLQIRLVPIEQPPDGLEPGSDDVPRRVTIEGVGARWSRIELR